MEALGQLVSGFGVALQPLNLALAFGGVFVGTVVGMLPGIGPINAIAMLIPLLFAVGLPPESALILLAGIYYGSQYGNSISTILLNVPGTAAAVVTALDGHAMTLRGRGGEALAMSAVASFVGGTLSIVGLVFLAPALSAWAIRFGPAEYFALMIFAFSALSSVAGDSVPKALAATGFGLLLATVGMDPNSAVPRFTFGQLKLFDGMDFVVVTIGLFAVSEVLLVLRHTEWGEGAAATYGRVTISFAGLRATAGTMLRGSVAGFFVGVLPGAGGTIASFVAYGLEEKVTGRGTDGDGARARRAGETPAEDAAREAGVSFGQGQIRGVAAPEAANNAATTGAMIPLLTLGIPGSGTTAVLLGALLGLGLTPGPLLIERNPEVFWGMAASMYVGNVFLLLLNLPLVGLFVKVLRLPRWVLMPGVAALSFVAVYAVNQSAFDLVLMAAFGVLGFLMRRAGFPLAPVILGLVLGPLMEKNLRRALALSAGDWSVMFSSGLAVLLWLLAAGALVVPWAWKRFRVPTLPEVGEMD